MNQLYEKRSIEKDGLPEKAGTYFGFIGGDQFPVMVYDLFNGKDWENYRVTHYLVPVSERAVEERAILWGCYMEGTDEKGISDDILLSVHSTQAGAHENSMRMQKEYGGKHYTDKVVIHA